MLACNLLLAHSAYDDDATTSVQGAAVGEVPVGAVLVHDGSLVARAHNLVEELRDPTAHAEMLVIKQVRDLTALLQWIAAVHSGSHCS